ncbi:MAG: thiamine-phosphate kinase [Candidatus Omnitrophota bacterium]
MKKELKKTLSKVGEFGLIELLSHFQFKTKGLIHGIGDDAAVVETSREGVLVLTTDMLIERIHFTKQMGAFAIGRKALACSLSDIAAMGTRPRWVLVSLGLPKNLSVDFVRKIYQGMNYWAKKFSASIIGGDIVENDKIIINVVCLGQAKKQEVVLRSGAQKGDQIFVTGPLGNSLKSGKHLWFNPRLEESQYLVKNFKPSAMIDISDGLAQDLSHILKESRVGAILGKEMILLNARSSIQQALYDGEDFELIFTLSPQKAKKLMASKNKRFKFYLIGEITGRAGQLILRRKDGQEKQISAKGFTHF